MEASAETAPAASPRFSKLADGLHTTARWILWLLAAGILGVVPWLFGGNGPEGYWWIVWSGRLAALPLLLWITASVVRREMPGTAFWMPVVCWGLLAAQVTVSRQNPSSVPQAPWVGTGFEAVAHDAGRPSTAFGGATRAEGQLWLALGLLALAARCVGLGVRLKRALLWLLVLNVTALAAAGLPAKFSGSPLILGKWPAPEWYFYSTFLYHNHWCAFALLGVGAATALVFTYRNLAVRGALAAAACVIAGSAPLSTSRLGTIAMVAFGGLVAAAAVRRRWGAKLPVTRTTAVLALSAALGLMIVGGGAFYFYKQRGAPGGHRTWASILHANPFGSRQTLAVDTLKMIRDKPWFGWGLGAYKAAFRFYQRPETRIVHNEGRITLYDHAHNDWLERWAELGTVGFTLFLAPGLGWIWLARRARPWPPLETWLVVGCVGVLLFALGDMVFVNRAVAAAFALLFPLALAPVFGVRASNQGNPDKL